MTAQRAGGELNVGNEYAVARGMEALLACARACRACIDACLHEESVRTFVRCIRLSLDCADLCTVTSTVALRDTEENEAMLLRLLDLCATAAETCAAECELHADYQEYCGRCASACRHCEETCRLTMQEIGGASGLVQTN